jgi:molybdopterin-binding protein
VAEFGATTDKRNLLVGTISRVPRSGNRGDVSLALEGGLQLVGFSAPANRLKVGSKAVAHLDESSVVIALAISIHGNPPLRPAANSAIQPKVDIF